MKGNLKISIVFLLVFTLFACGEKPVFTSYKSVGNSWHRDSIVSFNFEVQDTLQLYNMFLNLRTNNKYEFSNIFLIASIESPNQQIKVDTLEYIMASPDGKMLGSGFSDVKDSKLWFKENYRFSELGNHIIKVEQALRKRSEIEGIERLEGVTDVGLSVELTKNQ